MPVSFADDGGGQDRVLEHLRQQRLTLDGILQMQEQLQSLMLKQHCELQMRLTKLPSEMCTEQLGGDAESVLEEGPFDEVDSGQDDGAWEPSHSGWSAEDIKAEPLGEVVGCSEATSLPYPMPVPTTGKPPVPIFQSGSDIKSEPDVSTLVSVTRNPCRSCFARVKQVIAHPIFEAVMGLVIMLNFCTVFAELQWKGYGVAQQLGLRPDDNDWQNASKVFNGLEKAFNGAFLLELVFRIAVFQKEFFVDFMNIGDAVVVLLSCVDSFILDFVSSDPAASKLGVFARLIRVTRALRLLRFLRVLRFMGMFTSLRVLVRTIAKSVDSLVWSMAVLGFIVLAASMLLVQLTSDFLMDTDVELPKRVWVFENFGSAGRASYSMFEATFTAKWATHFGRPLIEDVSTWFSVFWILYTVAVNFAVVRVISALFLKQTMEVAAIDRDVIVKEKMKEHEKLLGKLEDIFVLGDQLGDGVLHKWEFEDMMKNPVVLDLFDELELDAAELLMLFNMLAEDDGVVDQDEFLSGVMKLKSNVRTVDMIQVLHEQSVLKKGLDVMKEGLEQIDSALHPRKPWKANSTPQKRMTDSQRKRRKSEKLGVGKFDKSFTRTFTDTTAALVVAGA